MAFAGVLSSGSLAQDSDIQQQLSNPIASLTLVPFQSNFDFKIGPTRDGSRVTTNIQPVVPFKLSDELSLGVEGQLEEERQPGHDEGDRGDDHGPAMAGDPAVVVRTIVPVVAQNDIFPGAGSQFGLADTLQSFFLVPRSVDGFTWGAGPAVQYRTGTDPLLTTGKWGAGPTAVVLQQVFRCWAT